MTLPRPLRTLVALACGLAMVAAGTTICVRHPATFVKGTGH
jgi:hypothetical protein